MSEGYDDSNRGVLFRNTRKEKETHADFRGHINVGGVEYWLDCWIKTPKAGGAKFLSLSIKAKEVKPAEDKPAATTPTEPDFLDDPIPFAHAWAVPLVGALIFGALHVVQYV